MIMVYNTYIHALPMPMTTALKRAGPKTLCVFGSQPRWQVGYSHCLTPVGIASSARRAAVPSATDNCKGAGVHLCLQRRQKNTRRRDVFTTRLATC